MNGLVQWLAGLPYGRTIRATSWVIPLLQTIHILAIGMMLSAIIMIDLRIWRISRSGTLVQTARQFLPWFWIGVVLVTVTGIILVIGEPRRTLLNGTFQIKLILMAIALVATIAFHIVLQWKSAVWDSNGGARALAGAFAGLILFVWFADTVAGKGRWIANLLPR